MSKSKITYTQIRDALENIKKENVSITAMIDVCESVMDNIEVAYYLNDMVFENLCNAVFDYWVDNDCVVDLDDFTYEMQRVQEEFMEDGQNYEITSSEVMDAAWEQAKNIIRDRLG